MNVVFWIPAKIIWGRNEDSTESENYPKRTLVILSNLGNQTPIIDVIKTDWQNVSLLDQG